MSSRSGPSTGIRTGPALTPAVEWRRQLGRPRTRWVLVVLLTLPLVVVAAFTLGEESDGSGARFSDLATLGSANFTVFMLFVTAELLLLILAALFVGDPIPSEASWSSLRYLLTAPVPRARLLTSKLLVGLGSTVAAMLLLLCWVLLVGGVAYGWAPLTVPAGGVLEWSVLVPRLAVAAAYILVGLLPFAAIAFWMGVRTDAPLAAVGVAVLAAIVSSILGALDALGQWRRGLPNYYAREWLDLFAGRADYAVLLPGVLWSSLWTVAFLALAYRHFARKDVLS
ncbi:MAG: ABC transporter permease [Actinomycetota bacterium]|nr:ABC transporter permease [Actinomycetota bacterium]